MPGNEHIVQQMRRGLLIPLFRRERSQCGLDDLVKPEDMTVITPEEFSLRYGDDEEDAR